MRMLVTEIEGITQLKSEELSTTLPTLGSLSSTTPTTSISQARTLPCFTATAGRWNFSSNGSNSISKSSLSGVIPRMLSGYRFTSPSSHTASLQSSSTTSSLAGLWLRYCAYSEAPCWSKTTCRNSSDEELMTVNLKLNLIVKFFKRH